MLIIFYYYFWLFIIVFIPKLAKNLGTFKVKKSQDSIKLIGRSVGIDPLRGKFKIDTTVAMQW